MSNKGNVTVAVAMLATKEGRQQLVLQNGRLPQLDLSERNPEGQLRRQLYKAGVTERSILSLRVATPKGHRRFTTTQLVEGEMKQVEIESQMTDLVAEIVLRPDIIPNLQYFNLVATAEIDQHLASCIAPKGLVGWLVALLRNMTNAVERLTQRWVQNNTESIRGRRNDRLYRHGTPATAAAKARC